MQAFRHSGKEFCMNFNVKNIKHSFFVFSQTYSSNNWSVIPVWGIQKPEAFKVATIAWSPFTQHYPDKNLCHHWFVTEKHQGIAVITGRISQLAVLDFDDPGIFRDFCNRYPYLAKTYTVQTPRGNHLYYRIPENCQTKTLKGQGIDWQYERRYVVAPPTQGYSIKNSQNPRLLSQRDISNIESFLNASTSVLTRYKPPAKTITQQELQSVYGKQARYGQRNEMLFKTGLLARDKGWSLQETIATLAPLHTSNQTAGESQTAREREAIATLKSVFSRPPRPITGIRQLPNTIREKLLSLKQTRTIRVIEGLRLKGYEAGNYITWQVAWSVLDGIVGRDSIIQALNATNETGQGLFERITGYENPSPQPPTHANAAICSSNDNDNKCLLITVSNSGKSREMGSPTHYFRLPSNVELARLLGVQLSSITDVLTLDDLKSAKTTRQALHYRFIERRPGKYSTQWLAKRLGVSKITKNRYDRVLEGLHKEATYTIKPIFWHNLNEIPDDFEVRGQFLEDDMGKRYPAKRVLAIKLLKQKHRLKLMTRGFNYYWVGHRFGVDTQALTTVVINNKIVPETDFSDYWQAFYKQAVAQMSQNRKNRVISDNSEQTAQYTSSSKTTLKTKKSTIGNMVHDEATLEAHATYIQERVNRLATAPEQKLSLSNARRLVETYGLSQIQNVLSRIEARHGVENPAGLLMVILRSEAKWKVS